MPRSFLLLFALALAPLAWQQDYTRTLRSPATVKGFIGGESHDRYMIHAREGQTMMIEFSWKLELDKEIGDNTAGVSLSDWPGFDPPPALKSGRNSKRTVWSGRVPRTNDYYIDVTAYPSAHYTLKVSVQ
jgi:hypothetical protein